jgi:hypothetical protein
VGDVCGNRDSALHRSLGRANGTRPDIETTTLDLCPPTESLATQDTLNYARLRRPIGEQLKDVFTDNGWTDAGTASLRHQDDPICVVFSHDHRRVTDDFPQASFYRAQAFLVALALGYVTPVEDNLRSILIKLGNQPCDSFDKDPRAGKVLHSEGQEPART